MNFEENNKQIERKKTEMDSYTKRQLSLWVSIIAIPTLLLTFWITKDRSIVAMLAISIVIYLGQIWSPKILMFIFYHLILGALIWYFLNEYWLPILSKAWDWLNNLAKAITYAGLVTFTFKSLVSCWDKETLGITDLGHWTIFGWLPKGDWAANLKNGPLGVFTGFPAWLVSIKKIPAEKKPVTKKFVIQVEIYEDPENRKFAAVFDTSFNEQAVDTLKILTTESSTNTLEKIFEKSLTDWLNNPAHNYKDVRGLKEKIEDIQRNVLRYLDDAEEIYGKRMSEPRVIDIQLPDSVIGQQIQEAEEITDTDGFIEQSRKLRAEFPNISDPELMNQINIMRKNARSVNITSTGSGRNIIAS